MGAIQTQTGGAESLTGRAGLGAYRFAGHALAPFAPALLARRARAGKEDPARLGERLGHPSAARPDGPVVWLHAASVGESLSLLPLIERLVSRWPSLTPLVTTGTVTSARLMAGRLPASALHQYAPVDLPGAVDRFLEFWRPGLGLWVESELWPNALAGLHRRGIPVLLVNARMSPRSYRRWRAVRPMARALLAPFALTLGQSQMDADRFRGLGARDVRFLGNLKFAAPPLPAVSADLQAAQSAMGARPRWLAASTHDGEETLAAMVHRALMGRHAGLLTILVPRHPNRGPQIAATLGGQGFKVGLRSHGDAPGADTEIYVADTLGELGLWYRLCDTVFVGGSLVPHGGHNPLEPARLNSAIVFGPHMENFQALADGLVAADGADQAAGLEALHAAVGRLLNSPDLVQQRATAAAKFADGQAQVLDATVDALTPWLESASMPSRHP